MVKEPEAKAIVEVVVNMARALGLCVGAEAIETAAQRDLKVQIGCDELQGHLFAMPMSARAVAQ